MPNHQNFLKRCVNDISGNVTSIFVVMSVPLLVAAGAAMDYSMGVNIKTKMQNALDAATQAVCTEGGQDPDTIIRNRLSASIAEFGLELLPPPEEGQDQPTPTGSQSIVLDTQFNQSTGSVIPKLITNMPTTLLGIAGVGEMQISASTEVSCGAKRLELSLMLDVTGSMGSSVNGETKLAGMKSAANDVFDIFSRNMADGNTRIALVPFAESVNVGEDLAPSVREYPSRTKTFRTGNGNQRRTYELTNCVTERNGNHRFTDDPPGPGRYLSPMYSSNGSCKPSQEIVPLTSDEANLRSVVESFTASGSTAGHLGTAWAWYLINDRWSHLFPAASQAEVPNEEELIKATILMTDGEYNTEYCQGVNDSTINCNSPNGQSESQAAALCEAMKEDGIVVYAVGFGLSQNSSTAQKLKDCATDDSKWFFPYDGDALRAAFQSIGRSLAAGQSGTPIVKK